MWSFINDGQCLENAHDSMVDAKAQSDVLTDARFVPFINRSNSIQLITEMFSKTQQNEWRKEIEPSRPVHAPWVELTRDSMLRWKPPPLHRYDGPNAGTLMSRKCTGNRVRLDLKSGQYCRMCYRKQVSTELKAKERKGRCRLSASGCPICKEPICKECWKEGYDRHA